MKDGLLQPPIDGIHHGVSRQDPLLRSPKQFEAIDNLLPSVDLGGLVARPGTRVRFALPKGGYLAAPHHHFRTTDGQRWLLLRRAETGSFEVRNRDTGALASLTASVQVRNYLAAGGGSKLRFLTIADTTLILNPEVTVAASTPAVPAMTSCYLYIRRTSTAGQHFWLKRSDTGGYTLVGIESGAYATREKVAELLALAVTNGYERYTIHANGNVSFETGGTIGPGVTASVVAPGVVKVTATAEIIEKITAHNDWDSDALVLIKGRVTSTSDLPPRFEADVPIAVDLGRGEAKRIYYVRYDPKINAYVECSYLSAGQSTATLDPYTMPVKLLQTGPAAFTIDTCPWTERTKGDNSSNPLPFFVGRKIADLATWKGRLQLACEDTLCMSQPDDLFNYFRETARESRPADPIEVPTDSPDLASIYHVVAFRNKLIVTADNAQLEVDPGGQPLTPDSAKMGTATRYALDKDCRPVVVGDSMYYTGTVEGRSALWEYAYEEASANNTATDLSKHVPGYVPGRVRKIVGSAQAGRLYLLASGDPAGIYVHTSYWKEQQRMQSAWSRLSLPGFTSLWDLWVDEGQVVVLGESTGHLWLVTMNVDADLGYVPGTDQRVDFLSGPIVGTWVPGGSYTSFPLPTGYADLPNLVLTLEVPGNAWVTEYTGTVVGSEFRVAAAVPAGTARIGARFKKTATFSPFYMTAGQDTQTPHGRLHVFRVHLWLQRCGEFLASIVRPDRAEPTRVRRSARVVGQASAQPVIARNVRFAVPFNSRGDGATLTIEDDSSAPFALTGYALQARFTNPFD